MGGQRQPSVALLLTPAFRPVLLRYDGDEPFQRLILCWPNEKSR
jgi:hypothetical protein